MVYYCTTTESGYYLISTVIDSLTISCNYFNKNNVLIEQQHLLIDSEVQSICTIKSTNDCFTSCIVTKEWIGFTTITFSNAIDNNNNKKKIIPNWNKYNLSQTSTSLFVFPSTSILYLNSSKVFIVFVGFDTYFTTVNNSNSCCDNSWSIVGKLTIVSELGQISRLATGRDTFSVVRALEISSTNSTIVVIYKDVNTGLESVHWCDIILENKTLRTSWMVSFSTESIACCTVDASRRLLIAKNHSITIYNHDGYCHEVELCNIFKSCSTDKISSVVDNAVHLGSNNHSRLTLLVSFTSGKYCCVDVSLLKWEITRVTDLYAFDLFAWNMRHHHCLPFLNCSEEMTLLNCYNSNQNIFVVFGVAKLFGYELIGLAADPIMYSPQMSIPLDDVCHLTAVGRTVFADDYYGKEQSAFSCIGHHSNNTDSFLYQLYHGFSCSYNSFAELDTENYEDIVLPSVANQCGEDCNQNSKSWIVVSSRLANCTTAYRLFDSTVECTSNEKVKLVEDKYCLGVAIGSEAIIQFGIESYYRIDSSDSKNRSCHAYKSIIQSSDRSLWKYFNMDSKDSIYNSDKATYSAHSVKVYSIFSVVQMQDMLLVLGLDAQVVRIFCMPDIASFAITMYQSDLQKTTVPYMAITLWSLELFVLNIESDDWSNTSITQLFPLDVPRMLSIIPVMENDEENQTEENTREAVALPTKCIAVVAVASHSCMKAFACISTDGKLSLALLASYSFLQIYSVSDLINDSSKSGIILSSNSRSHLLYIWRNKLILEDFFLGKVISSKQTILTSGRNQTLIWVDQHIDRNSNLTSMSLNSIGVNSIFDTLEQHKKSTHIINRNYLEGRIHSIYEFGRSNFIVHLVTSRANHEEILVLKHDFSVALRMVLADSNSRSRKNSSTNRKIIRILTTISNNVSSNIDKLSHSFTMISVADNLPNLNAIDITILYYDEHKNSLRPISTAKLAYSDTNDNGILLSKTNNNENLIVYTPDNYLHVLTWKATSSPEPSSLVVSLNVILKYSLDEKLKPNSMMCYEHNNVAMYSIDKGITLYHYDSQQNGFFLIRTIVVKDTMYNHIYAHSVPVKTRNYTYVSPYLMEVQEISATRLIGVDRETGLPHIIYDSNNVDVVKYPSVPMESTSSTETVTSTSEIVLYGEVNDTTVDITVIQVKNTLLYLTSRYDNNKQVITKILSHRSFLSAEGEQNYIYYAISSSGLVTELIQERLG